jgi:hypothetical protein
MGLVACRDCGKEVSDRAATCPACGGPMQGANASAAGPAARPGPSKAMRLVALLASFGMLYVGAQLFAGGLEADRNRDASPASTISLFLMSVVCFGCPVAVYMWAVKKRK